MSRFKIRLYEPQDPFLKGIRHQYSIVWTSTRGPRLHPEMTLMILNLLANIFNQTEELPTFVVINKPLTNPYLSVVFEKSTPRIFAAAENIADQIRLAWPELNATIGLDDQDDSDFQIPLQKHEAGVFFRRSSPRLDESEINPTTTPY